MINYWLRAASTRNSTMLNLSKMDEQKGLLLNSNRVKKILAIELRYIGDMLFITPALRAIKENFPNAHLSLLMQRAYRDIMGENPCIDKLILYVKETGLPGFVKILRRIRKEEFDLVINFHDSWRCILFTALSKAKFKVGYNLRGQGVFLDAKLTPAYIKGQPKHEVDSHLDLVRIIGASEVNNKDPQMWITKQDRRFASQFLNKHKIGSGDLIIGLNAGGSWPTKRWPEEKFARLGDRLIKDYNAKVLVFGGPQDISLLQRLKTFMRETPIVAKINLRQLAALAQRCDLFISNDSGPVHIAAAIHTPTIAIFGPSDPRKYAPYGKGHLVVRKDLPCSPCGQHRCKSHDCMKLITVEDVLGAAMAQLKKARQKVQNETWKINRVSIDSRSF